MQYSKRIAVVAAFAGLANAQSQCLTTAAAIPPCALGYIASVAYYDFSCGLADFGCDCSNLEGIANTAVPIIGNTQTDCDINAVFTSAQALCGCATSFAPSSVTLNAVESACQPSAAAIPPCALGYLASAGAALGCAINNFECQCSNFNAIAGSIVGPVQSACGTQFANVLGSAQALCACVTSQGLLASVPATVPTVSATPSVSLPVTVSATPSVPVSVPSVTGVSTPSLPVSLPGGSGSSSGSAAGSGTGSGAGSGTAKASGSASGATTGKATTSGPQMQSGTYGATSSLPVFTGAGATASAFGGMIGVVAGLVAFL